MQQAVAYQKDGKLFSNTSRSSRSRAGDGFGGLTEVDDESRFCFVVVVVVATRVEEYVLGRLIRRLDLFLDD